MIGKKERERRKEKKSVYSMESGKIISARMESAWKT
jgi:hypothetical protein